MAFESSSDGDAPIFGRFDARPLNSFPGERQEAGDTEMTWRNHICFSLPVGDLGMRPSVLQFSVFLRGINNVLSC